MSTCQIFHNESQMIIFLIVCCLIVLAVIMIPKAIRHRTQIKQNQGGKPVPKQEQKEGTGIVPQENRDKKQPSDYRKVFLTTPKLEDRKTVFISRSTRDSLEKIARRLGDRKMSVSGFLENMANHHLKEYKDEINKLYKE